MEWKMKKEPQMAFCIKINKQKNINANKTKNQHGCEKHNSHTPTHKHTSTQSIHVHTCSQMYAIKMNLHTQQPQPEP